MEARARRKLPRLGRALLRFRPRQFFGSGQQCGGDAGALRPGGHRVGDGHSIWSRHLARRVRRATVSRSVARAPADPGAADLRRQQHRERSRSLAFPPCATGSKPRPRARSRRVDADDLFSAPAVQRHLRNAEPVDVRDGGQLLPACVVDQLVDRQLHGTKFDHPDFALVDERSEARSGAGHGHSAVIRGSRPHRIAGRAVVNLYRLQLRGGRVFAGGTDFLNLPRAGCGELQRDHHRSLRSLRDRPRFRSLHPFKQGRHPQPQPPCAGIGADRTISRRAAATGTPRIHGTERVAGSARTIGTHGL